MAPNCRTKGHFQVLCYVEALPDIVETVELDHEMMNVVFSGLN